MTQIDTSTETVEALLNGVTQGPWHISIDDDGNPLSGRPSVQATEELDCAIVHWDGFVQRFWRSARGDREIHANARFIAASRELVPALLTERDAYRAVLEGAEYPAIDNIPLLGPRAARAVGAEVKARTLQAISERNALSAITARTEDDVWNEAIEAAALKVNCEGLRQRDEKTAGLLLALSEAILALARPTKGETK